MAKIQLLVMCVCCWLWATQAISTTTTLTLSPIPRPTATTIPSPPATNGSIYSPAIVGSVVGGFALIIGVLVCVKKRRKMAGSTEELETSTTRLREETQLEESLDYIPTHDNIAYVPTVTNHTFVNQSAAYGVSEPIRDEAKGDYITDDPQQPRRGDGNSDDGYMKNNPLYQSSQPTPTRTSDLYDYIDVTH